MRFHDVTSDSSSKEDACHRRFVTKSVSDSRFKEAFSGKLFLFSLFRNEIHLSLFSWCSVIKKFNPPERHDGTDQKENAATGNHVIILKHTCWNLSSHGDMHMFIMLRRQIGKNKDKVPTWWASRWRGIPHRRGTRENLHKRSSTGGSSNWWRDSWTKFTRATLFST